MAVARKTQPPAGQEKRPFTRDDFLRDLKKAAKRTEPQKDRKTARSK